MFDPHFGPERYSCVLKGHKLVIRLTLEKKTGLTPLLSSLLFCAVDIFPTRNCCSQQNNNRYSRKVSLLAGLVEAQCLISTGAKMRNPHG